MNFYNSKFALFFKPKTATHWAITLPWGVYYSAPKSIVDKDLRWIAHEECHLRQWKQYWYIGFLILYCVESIIHGYWNNRFEVEARNVSEKLEIYY